ncbi:helix-turn-helix transcriptional regulator [Mycolicibacterium sp. 624]|uniref:helix-turn-helix transcriptional regulator n=1 Tax=Mycolicibacterium sp. 624 TaxID=3156314 RepID=UPI003399DD86
MSEQGEGRSSEPSSVRDLNFVSNMVRLRSELGMSQADLVQKLRDGQWPTVHQTTISRIEKQERQVRLGEAWAIADALKTNVYAMVLAPNVFDANHQLRQSMERVAHAYDTLGESVWRLVDSRRALRRAVENARRVLEREGGGPEDGGLAGKRGDLPGVLRSAEAHLAMRVDRAVAAGREASREESESFVQYSDFARVHGSVSNRFEPDLVAIDDDLRAEIDAADA